MLGVEWRIMMQTHCVRGEIGQYARSEDFIPHSVISHFSWAGLLHKI